MSRRGEKVTLLPAPLSIVGDDHGAGIFATPPADDDAAELQCMLFPGVDFTPAHADGGATRVLDGEAVRRVAAAAFRAPAGPAATPIPPYDPMSAPTPPRIDPLAALALLNNLRSMSPCHSVTTSHATRAPGAAVTVELSTCYFGTVSDATAAPAAGIPDGGARRCAFAYRVLVSNVGSERVQVVGRHWVFEWDGGVIEVRACRRAWG